MVLTVQSHDPAYDVEDMVVFPNILLSFRWLSTPVYSLHALGYF